MALAPMHWEGPFKEGLIDRVLNIATAVNKNVELSSRLCYGDFGHKHFMEPKDTSLLV